MPENHRPTYWSAKDLPPWTDAYRYVPADAGPFEPPDDEDRRWAAANNDDFHDDGPVPDHVIDQAAEEAEAQDRYERGLDPG
ncbi:hypothetical protein [Tautonia plasticadhaerens]|uniref:Uncharacterized protein n=1 Tax=Tautonia plasticadhaerens TaxID=2527974 RepID=A0A518H3D0_9BACT|nr:hypothetical protein [Tautonia plasticadhaerens]QDV35344.1 hypothetical protein ElP_32470 [Tautonia plasticadhaerens]